MPGSDSFVLEAALRHGPWIAALAALAVTPFGYALVALVLERRILRPASEFLAVSFGDPVLAVAIGLGVWLLGGRNSAGVTGPVAGVVNLTIWLGFGLWQWRDETRNGFYTRDQAAAPTKAWHQLVVYPVLGYWIWVACVGGLLTPGTAISRISARAGIVAAIVCWALTTTYDRRHPKLGHPPYDWRRIRPKPEPWAPQSTSLRTYLRARKSSGSPAVHEGPPQRQ